MACSVSTPQLHPAFRTRQDRLSIGVEDYRRFAAEYEYFGRSVWQQTLNLTAEEQRQLITLLEKITARKTGYTAITFLRQLRYPSTGQGGRESAKSGSQLLFSNAHTENGETKSYRDIVHQYTKGHP